MRTARASGRISWCIFRISPRTIHSRRTSWTKRFSNAASRRRKTSAPRGQDIFGIKVCGFRSIGKFLATRRALRAIRAFNLTHMNRGRNAYQASHCYSLADYMLSDGGAQRSRAK
jgi:hypothetical protein